MKCSGVRVLSKGYKLCEKKATNEYEGYCSYEHDKQASTYASAKAYEDHMTTISIIKKKPTLYKGFNTQIRPAFASIIEAGMAKEQLEMLNRFGPTVTQNAKEAWKSASVGIAMKKEIANNLQEQKEYRAKVDDKLERYNLAEAFYRQKSDELKELEEIDEEDPIEDLTKRCENVVLTDCSKDNPLYDTSVGNSPSF